jgi:hypothetical protein
MIVVAMILITMIVVAMILITMVLVTMIVTMVLITMIVVTVVRCRCCIGGRFAPGIGSDDRFGCLAPTAAEGDQRQHQPNAYECNLACHSPTLT